MMLVGVRLRNPFFISRAGVFFRTLGFGRKVVWRVRCVRVNVDGQGITKQEPVNGGELGTIYGYIQHAMLFTTHHHHHHLLLLRFHFELSRLSVYFPLIRCFGIRGKFLVGIDGKTVDEHTLVWFDTGLE